MARSQRLRQDDADPDDARPRAGRGRDRGLRLQRPRQEPQALARVGGIVEEPRFYPYLSGRENLEVWATHYGGEAHTRIDAALERVGLGDRADDAVKTYSLGMRQRLGVARALLNDPKLLILDEPTNGLDPAGLAEFRELIRSFVDEGRSVFISSHILGEVQKMADDVAIIQKGKMIAFGCVDELVSGGQKVYVRTSDDAAAQRVDGALDGPAWWAASTADGDGLLNLTLDHMDDQVAMLVNRTLVQAGIGVSEITHERETLEERFLDVTAGATPGEINPEDAS